MVSLPVMWFPGGSSWFGTVQGGVGLVSQVSGSGRWFRLVRGGFGYGEVYVSGLGFG